MSIDKSSSRKGSWKQAGNGATSKPLYGWQKGSPQAAPAAVKKPPRKPSKLLWASLGLLGCVAALIALIILFRPKQPARLVLVEAPALDNLAIPHNVYGARSVADFLNLRDMQVGPPLWRTQPIRLLLDDGSKRLAGPHWKDDWDAMVRQWKDARFGEKTVVIYLALHGGSDRQGAYLLPDASGNDVDRLRLERVLDDLAGLPAEKNKVLILDATQIPDDWRLGLLHNDFARQLKGLQEKILAVPNLWVLASSDENQRSWVSDQWQRSVFAHYIIEGLRGAADSGKDYQVSLAELYDYLTAQVGRWAAENRGVKQTPLLLPDIDRDADAGNQARKVVLTIVDPDTPAPASSPSVAETGALAAQEATTAAWWARYRALDASRPHPAAYTPHQWRRFRDVLIRLDQLTRAGARADSWDRELRRLEDQINAGSRLELSNSHHNSLVMAAAEGPPLPQDHPDRALLDALWTAPEKDFPKLWKERVGPQDLAGFRVGFQAYILDRLLEPGRTLELARANRLVNERPLQPYQPAEVHFLSMLAANLPPDPAGQFLAPDDLIRRALEVRRLAERAALAAEPGTHAQSEEILPWIQNIVERADADRRQGEDLLFATDPASWEKAGQALDRARDLYNQAQHRADEVRLALETRNRVLIELPDYSRWWADRVSLAEPPQPADGALISDEQFTDRLVDLWAKVHALVTLLEEPSESAALAAATEAIRSGFAEVEDRFIRDLKDFDWSRLPRDWTPEVALAVPYIDTEGGKFPARGELPSRRPGRASTGTNAAPGAIEDRSEELAIRAHGRAETQGRLALAVLGRDVFNAIAGKDLTAYDKVLDRLQATSSQTNWPETTAFAGEEVARRWQLMPEVLSQRLVEGSGKLQPQDAAVLLAEADRLARLLDGATELGTEKPVQVRRRRQVHDLLIWLAGRTWRDHWYGGSDPAAPYFRAAGQRLVGDALALVPESQAALAMQKTLDQPGELELDGPATLAWTSEQQVDLDYNLRPAPGATVPPGTATVWGATEGPALLRPADGAGGRIVQAVEAASAGADAAGSSTGARSVRFSVRSPRVAEVEGAPLGPLDPQQTTFQIHGFYRGQEFSYTTAVALYPEPDSVRTNFPTPPGGSVTVQAEGEIIDQFGNNNASLAIVLDASGSMWDRKRFPTFNMRTRYGEALTALDQMLRRVPKGTRLSLWVFGRDVGNQKRVTNADWTIEQIQPPVAWDPGNARQREALMARVTPPTLEPWNDTPLIRTMVRAKQDLLAGAGFKTLVVLTDGVDSDYTEQTRPQIPQVLQQHFGDTRIMINMVCFQASNVEEIRRWFGDPIEKKLPVPGRFFTVDQAPQLADVLVQAIDRDLRFRVDELRNVATDADRSGLPISELSETAAWNPLLAPNFYNVVVDTIGLKGRISLSDGDRLLLNLASGPRGEPRLERNLYAREAQFQFKEQVKQAGWSLAALQNRLERDGQLSMRLALEKLFEPDETHLEQIEPDDVWLEVQAEGEPGVPVNLSWSERDEYPAEVWALEVPAWPIDAQQQPAKATLRVWWDRGSEAASAVTLERARKDFGDPLRIRDLSTPPIAGGSPATIESVRIENRRVPDKPAAVPCLVVRLRYPPGQPAFARAGGIDYEVSQHRFYAEANKSTSLFWPVNQDEVDKDLDTLEIVSVSAFKARAESRGFFIAMPGLVPSPNEPPIDPIKLEFGASAP